MTPPAIPGVTRHFVTLGHRQVHYRRAGRGPALVALHRAPRSSADLVPFMQAALPTFTVIAPDLAGYGNSWPLTSAANIEAYAADVEAFLDTLGIKSCVLYGEGLGAAAALTLMTRNAGRFTAAALNDVPPVLSAADQAEARAAWPAFMPQWDGSHLAWLWAYLREENAFQPWYRKQLATRVIADMPSPETLQARAVQFLSGAGQGRGYAAGALAVLDFDADRALARIQAPVARQLGWENSVTFLAARSGAVPPPPPPPAVKPIPGALWSDYVSISGGQLHVRANHDFDSLPLLVQHDAASSVGTIEPVARPLIGKRAVMCFDLPGSGDSDNTLSTDGLTRPVEVDVYAEALRAALDALGLKQVDFYGMWGGGFVGLDMALQEPGRIRRLAMSNLFQHDGAEQQLFTANYTPPVEPVWHGGHLMQAWHQMRDQGIYYPWFDRTARGVIQREPFLATDMVHERVCSLLKAGNMYRAAYHAHFRYRTYEKLGSSPVPTLIATTKWDPNNPQTQAAAKAAPNAQFTYLDEDFTKWGVGLLALLQ